MNDPRSGPCLIKNDAHRPSHQTKRKDSCSWVGRRRELSLGKVEEIPAFSTANEWYEQPKGGLIHKVPLPRPPLSRTAALYRQFSRSTDADSPSMTSRWSSLPRLASREALLTKSFSLHSDSSKVFFTRPFGGYRRRSSLTTRSTPDLRRCSQHDSDSDWETEDEFVEESLSENLEKMERLLQRVRRKLTRALKEKSVERSGPSAETTFLNSTLDCILDLLEVLQRDGGFQPNSINQHISSGCPLGTTSDDSDDNPEKTQQAKMITDYHRRLCGGDYLSPTDASDIKGVEHAHYHPHKHGHDHVHPGLEMDLPGFNDLLHENDELSLQDCRCAAGSLPELDIRGMENVLELCHQRLFHKLPSLAVDFSAILKGGQTAGKLRELWLRQVGELLHVLNEERRTLAGVFSCALDTLKVSTEEQEALSEQLSSSKQEYEQQLSSMEETMSKQIANLLRVVENQEVIMLDQKRRIRLLESEKDELEKISEGESPPERNIYSPGSAKNTSTISAFSLSKHFVSMPQLDMVSPKHEKKLIHRRRSSIGLNGLRSVESCQSLTRDDLRTMARAMSWIQMDSSVMPSDNGDNQPNDSKWENWVSSPEEHSTGQ